MGVRQSSGSPMPRVGTSGGAEPSSCILIAQQTRAKGLGTEAVAGFAGTAWGHHSAWSEMLSQFGKRS